MEHELSWRGRPSGRRRSTLPETNGAAVPARLWAGLRADDA